MTRQQPITLLAIVLLLAAATPLLAAPQPGQFLTGPAEGSPRDIALQYLEEHTEELGLNQGDLVDLVVSDEYLTQHNGVTHVYFQQRLSGVEVVNGLLNVNVMSDGRILHLGNRFVGDLAGKVSARAPSLQPEDAVALGAEHLGLELRAPLIVLETIGGPAMEVRFSDGGISKSDIPAELRYLPPLDGRGAVRLVWSLFVEPRGTDDYWNLFVDATTGEVPWKLNYTVHEEPYAEAGQPAGSSSEASNARGGEGDDGVCTSNCYTVYAIPKESPDDGPRTVEDNPADGTASPFGWHDTNGVGGAEFTDSRGNNVEAQTDLDANNVFSAGDVRSIGGPSLIFADPIDLTMDPGTYKEAAVTNLFYWNNVMHDLTFQYGFDEAGGNFQFLNYGGMGSGNDLVQADAQDGSGTNNANFLTLPEGVPGSRMQMFRWTGFPNARVTVNSPGGIAGDYVAGGGGWGGALAPPTTADFELVADGTATNEGCNALIGFTPGNIALIDRGTCEFGLKALNAENAGATGAIIINDQQLPNGIIVMGAGVSGGSVTIPSVMIGSADGTTIRGQEPAPGVNGTIQEPVGGPPVDRDSDLDNGIIVHEYGHGVSNRLVGGPANVGCLGGSEQMGEGMSDWWTLTLTAKAGQTGTLARGVGNYVIFEPPTGPGIRNFRYSTDMAVNPQTYADIATTNIPHGVGEIWNAMAWEMYWLLVDRYGFDTDLYNGSGGNNLAIQLVIDSMKLQPCNSTFVDSRDALLAADLALSGGADACAIWRGFAKRGVGVGAVGGTINVGDEVESFLIPDGTGGLPDCEAVFTDGFESGDTTAWSAEVP